MIVSRETRFHAMRIPVTLVLAHAIGLLISLPRELPAQASGTKDSLESRMVVPDAKTVFRDTAGTIIPKTVFDSTRRRDSLTYDRRTEGGRILEQRLRRWTDAERALLEGMYQRRDSALGTIIPDFQTQDIEGRPVVRGDFGDKILVMNFWFLGCPPCLKEIPELNRLVERYHDSANVIFLAFGRDDAEAIRSRSDIEQFRYRLIPSARAIASAFGIKGYPTHIVADGDGVVRFFREGYGPGVVNGMDAVISMLLRRP